VAGWGVLQRGELGVGITRHPMRKSVAVVVVQGSVIYTSAYCRNEQEAQRLWDALVQLVEAIQRERDEALAKRDQMVENGDWWVAETRRLQAENRDLHREIELVKTSAQVAYKQAADVFAELERLRTQPTPGPES
jgi:predicted  nucleic acid-binding Zn-ribbon protein